MKVAIVFCTLAIAASVTSSVAENEEFYNEELCANQGGNCIKKDECPIEILDEYKGLCPEQQSQGAECCHGISIRENRCRKLGGECFADNCYQEIHQIHQATDCPSNEVCCLLF